MTQATPTQELVTRDLHGFEWRFKHIFRGIDSNLGVFLWNCVWTKWDIDSLSAVFGLGQPRRHLLTTGWSTFVSSKRLVAGDAFVFLRYFWNWNFIHWSCLVSWT